MSIVRVLSTAFLVLAMVAACGKKSDDKKDKAEEEA
jgi:hypothetical protein